MDTTGKATSTLLSFRKNHQISDFMIFSVINIVECNRVIIVMGVKRKNANKINIVHNASNED